MIAIGYARCSTEQQATGGVTLDQQHHALQQEAERRGWELEFATDTGSGKTLERPALEHALERLAIGDAEILVATRLDRISRTVGDFAALMARAEGEGWALVVLDPPVDLTTPFGKAMAHVAAAFAQLERELISQRTKEGIAEAKRRGSQPGPRGSGKIVPVETVMALKSCWDRGLSYDKTAAELNALGIPTANGDVWNKKRVRYMKTKSPIVREVLEQHARPAAPAVERVERLPAEPRKTTPTLPPRRQRAERAGIEPADR